MNLHKQNICCLGYMSKMTLIFVNVEFLEKILEEMKK